MIYYLQEIALEISLLLKIEGNLPILKYYIQEKKPWKYILLEWVQIFKHWKELTEF